MTDPLAAAVICFASAVGLLVVFIVAVRLRARRRRRREQALRQLYEEAVARFLVLEGEEPLRAPSEHGGAGVFRSVVHDALLELAGRERDRLIQALEQAGTVGADIADLASRVRSTRRRAADALAVYPSELAREALLRCLDDEDIQTRLACARALAGLRAPELVEPVLAVAEASVDQSPGGVAEVLLTLARFEPSALAERLGESGSPALRRLLASVIGELRLAEGSGVLREVLASDDEELVARAARGLGQIGDAHDAPRLLALLEDRLRSPFVRAAAARSLGLIGDPSAIRALEWALREEDWWLAVRAARALAELGELGREALERAKLSEHAWVRSHVAAVLA